MANKVRVVINKSNVAKLDTNAQKAFEMAVDATLTDIVSAQVIPFDVGIMQNDQTFADTSKSSIGESSIITSSTQSTRLYFHPEYNFQTVNNPNAKAGWFDEWITGPKNDYAKKAFARFMKKFLGG